MSVDISALAQEALKVAVESIVNKIKEGKRLSTEDVFLLYLATMTKELDDMRREIDDVRKEIDNVRGEIAETNKRMLEMQNELSKRIDAVMLSLSQRIDETNKRIDGLYALLLDIQKLLVEIARKSGV